MAKNARTIYVKLVLFYIHCLLYRHSIVRRADCKRMNIRHPGALRLWVRTLCHQRWNHFAVSSRPMASFLTMSSGLKKKNDYCKQNMFPARLELATFRVLGGHDNHSLRKLRRRIQAKL